MSGGDGTTFGSSRERPLGDGVTSAKRRLARRARCGRTNRRLWSSGNRPREGEARRSRCRGRAEVSRERAPRLRSRGESQREAAVQKRVQACSEREASATSGSGTWTLRNRASGWQGGEPRRRCERGTSPGRWRRSGAVMCCSISIGRSSQGEQPGRATRTPTAWARARGFGSASRTVLRGEGSHGPPLGDGRVHCSMQ
jgi:hypothetical protein